jgi:nicotinamide mononucleotide transporter
MSTLEWCAAALILANIILAARRNVWNFPVAIVAVSLYGVVFWQAKLYSMAGLQLFFIAMNVYGWLEWKKEKTESGDVRVRYLGIPARFAWIAVSFAAVAGWGTIMQHLVGGPFPYSDAAGAMLSVVAQLLMVWRYVENWAWWIAVNIISVVLFMESGLFVSSGLYMINWVLAVYGLIRWSRDARVQAKAA